MWKLPLNPELRSSLCLDSAIALQSRTELARKGRSRHNNLNQWRKIEIFHDWKEFHPRITSRAALCGAFQPGNQLESMAMSVDRLSAVVRSHAMLPLVLIYCACVEPRDSTNRTMRVHGVRSCPGVYPRLSVGVWDSWNNL